MKHRPVLSVTALMALSVFSSLAEDPKPDPNANKPAAEKPKPTPTEHVTKAGPFQIKINLDAFFTAKNEHKISLNPEAWSDMTLLSALPHGTNVKKGDKLLTIDTKKLNKAIEEAELGEPAAILAFKILESELALLEKSTPVQLEATRRGKLIADETWDHYEKVGHAEALRATELSLHFAQQSFDYAKEEYEQLQKMYEADDLTEETEEIILKRAKNSFDRASENLRLSKMRIDRQLKVMLPRQLVANKATVESGAITYDGAMLSLPRTLEQKRYAVKKATRDRNKAKDQLNKLKTDLTSFNVTAPVDGTLYYGLSKDGKWITAPAISKKMIPGGKISPHEVFMTVVEQGELSLAANVPEDKLAHLKKDLSATATPVSNPSLKIKSKVLSVNHIPGSFSAKLTAEIQNPHIFPGMAAKVIVSAADFDNVITVPNGLIDGENVWVMEGEEKKARPVKLGPSDGKLTVILEGLQDGEKVVSK